MAEKAEPEPGEVPVAELLAACAAARRVSTPPAADDGDEPQPLLPEDEAA